MGIDAKGLLSFVERQGKKGAIPSWFCDWSKSLNRWR